MPRTLPQTWIKDERSPITVGKNGLDYQLIDQERHWKFDEISWQR